MGPTVCTFTSYSNGVDIQKDLHYRQLHSVVANGGARVSALAAARTIGNPRTHVKVRRGWKVSTGVHHH